MIGTRPLELGGAVILAELILVMKHPLGLMTTAAPAVAAVAVSGTAAVTVSSAAAIATARAADSNRRARLCL